MFVRTYLMILVLGCAACGISLYFGIKFIDHEVEEAAEAKSQSALLISDFRRLEESFAQWLVLTDLVLGADETYLSAGAVDLGEKIHHLSNEIKFVAPKSTIVSFDIINSFTKNQTDRLQQATELNSEGRNEKLNRLLVASDEESENALECLQLIEQKLNDHLVGCNEAYKSTVQGRGVRNAGLLFCFAFCVYGLWLWVSKIVSNPISKLSDATRQAMVDRELLADPSKGPQEVRLLTSNFSELFSDLTDQIELQKKTQKEREALYEKLVDTSRRAGMAEVATGVLHNVGNVLNSVKVAASVARDSAKRSIVTQLQATNELIASQENLGDFLTNDARGKRFPEALGYLSDELVNEREKQLNELESLLERVDHIDEIVKSQQVFAKSDACLEKIVLNDLLEHAIGIKRPSFAKAGVVIVRHFDERISIKTEKHRLLQVIVNLLTNALEAIAMCGDDRREINVHLKRSGQRVKIEVQDTGIGISSENLNQLFNHGFTTKENGHGFGLHSSAIAVQALGANLKAESEGLTLGATFTVDLPVEQSELCKV